ncbi:MAG: response regulator [Elusimicrobia bacterium]|nr:response regulator [Elusimicrobiota bacterium]
MAGRNGETKKRILVIDDEEGIRELLVDALELQGYHVLTASNGKTGLIIAQEDLPDLILLDYYLFDINGGTLHIKLKEDPRTQDIPVITMSAKEKKDDNVLQTFTEHLGGLHIKKDSDITKPFDMPLLFRRIREKLDSACIAKQPCISNGKSGAFLKTNGFPSNDTARIIEEGIFKLDTELRVLTISGKIKEEINFTQKPCQFKIFRSLMQKAHQAVSFPTLAHETIEDPNDIPNPRSTQRQVERLRETLGPWGAYITTIEGAGVVLKPPKRPR